MKNKAGKFIQRLSFAAINIFESPWGAAFAALFIYLLVSAYTGYIFRRSDQAYYNYLADAFLHGQTWLRQTPPSLLDLSYFNDKLFLYWAPFPAILLMPFIAIFGVQLNDVMYTLLIAALNVGLIAQLLRTATKVGFLHLSKTKRAILVFFFAFGTVHFTLAPFGTVWHTGQIIGFTCTILAYLAAFSLQGAKAWFFTGLALSGAMLTRNQLVFTGIFPFMYLFFQQKSDNRIRLLQSIAMGLLPLTISLVFYLLYNDVRFGRLFESGVNYQLMSNFYRSSFEQFGVFDLHYLPTNLYYQYIFYPFPYRPESIMGGSLFLLSPLFFGAFFTFWKPRSVLNTLSLWFSILITNIPILLVIGTGYWQIGPRYTLDFTVPLLLLTAIGITNWKPIIALILTIISMIHYLLGVNILSQIK